MKEKYLLSINTNCSGTSVLPCRVHISKCSSMFNEEKGKEEMVYTTARLNSENGVTMKHPVTPVTPELINNSAEVFSWYFI